MNEQQEPPEQRRPHNELPTLGPTFRMGPQPPPLRPRQQQQQQQEQQQQPRNGPAARPLPGLPNRHQRAGLLRDTHRAYIRLAQLHPATHRQLFERLPQIFATCLSNLGIWLYATTDEALEYLSQLQIPLELLLEIAKWGPGLAELVVTHLLVPQYQVSPEASMQQVVQTFYTFNWRSRSFVPSAVWTITSRLAYAKCPSPGLLSFFTGSEDGFGSGATSLGGIIAWPDISAILFLTSQASRVPAELEVRRVALRSVRGDIPSSTAGEDEQLPTSNAQDSTNVPTHAVRRPASWFDLELRAYLAPVFNLGALGFFLNDLSLQAARWSLAALAAIPPSDANPLPSGLFALTGLVEGGEAAQSRALAWMMLQTTAAATSTLTPGYGWTVQGARVLFESARQHQGLNGAAHLRAKFAGKALFWAGTTFVAGWTSDSLTLLRSRALTRWARAIEGASLVGETAPGPEDQQGPGQAGPEEEEAVVEEEAVEEAEPLLQPPQGDAPGDAPHSPTSSHSSNESQGPSLDQSHESELLVEPPSLASLSPTTTASTLEDPPYALDSGNDDTDDAGTSNDVWGLGLDLAAMRHAGSSREDVDVSRVGTREHAGLLDAALRSRFGDQEAPSTVFEDDFESDEEAQQQQQPEEGARSSPSTASPHSLADESDADSTLTAQSTPSPTAHLPLHGVGVGLDAANHIEDDDDGADDDDDAQPQQPLPALDNAQATLAHLFLSARTREQALDSLPRLPFVPEPPLIPVEPEGEEGSETRESLATRVLFSSTARNIWELLGEVNAEEGTAPAWRALLLRRGFLVFRIVAPLLARG